MAKKKKKSIIKFANNDTSSVTLDEMLGMAEAERAIRESGPTELADDDRKEWEAILKNAAKGS